MVSSRVDIEELRIVLEKKLWFSEVHHALDGELCASIMSLGQQVDAFEFIHIGSRSLEIRQYGSKYAGSGKESPGF